MALKATRTYIEGLANGLAENSNVTIKEGQEWSTDVKTSTIQYEPLSLQNLPPNVVKGLLVHEVGHVKHTTELQDSLVSKANKSMQDVYNVLEDVRIEKKLQDQYGDFASEGIEAGAVAAGIMRKDSFKKGEFQKAPKLQQLLLNLMSTHYMNEYSNNDLYDNNVELKRNTAPEVLKKINDNYATLRNMLERAKHLDSTAEVQELADRELYPILKDFIEEANQQPTPEMHGSIPKQEGGKPSLTGNGKNRAQIPTDEDLDMLLSPYINTLARRLQDVLKERLATRFTGNHKTGKLLAKNAYKVLTDDTRIFSKKRGITTPNYVISMLLDESGSMQGQRHENTYIAAYLIKKACEKLKFKVQFVQYETHARFTQSKMGLYRTNFQGGGNNEVEALTELLKHTDDKDDNLVFIMTDGGAGIDPKPIMQKMQQKGYTTVAVAIGLSKKGNDTQYLRQNYPLTVVAEEVEQLPRLMIDLLKSLIHR